MVYWELAIHLNKLIHVVDVVAVHLLVVVHEIHHVNQLILTLLLQPLLVLSDQELLSDIFNQLLLLLTFINFLLRFPILDYHLQEIFFQRLIPFL